MTRPLSDPNVPADVADLRPHGAPAQCCTACDSHGGEPKARRSDGLPAIGAIVLAFLASQHHSLMMLLLAFGLGDAAMSFMTAAPIVRNVMLGLSLAMVAVILWQIRDSRRPPSMRIMGAVSVVASIGLSAWSITRFGW